MKFEQTIGGTRYIAQCERDFRSKSPVWVVSVYQVLNETCTCTPDRLPRMKMQHMPAFDAIAHTEHDARNQITLAFSMLRVRGAVLTELAEFVSADELLELREVTKDMRCQHGTSRHQTCQLCIDEVARLNCG